MRIRSVPIGLSVLIGIFTLPCSASGARLVDDEIKSPAKPEHQPWIESGADKGVLARHSKSPDGRYALAWVPGADSAAIDWELLKNAPDSFYEKYDLRELWVVDRYKIESFVHWVPRLATLDLEVIAP